MDVRRRIARERVPTAPPAPNTERGTLNVVRLFSRRLANFSHPGFIRIADRKECDAVLLRRFQSRNSQFRGHRACSSSRPGAETNTRIVDMHPSRADLLTKYKLQSGPSQR